MFQIMYFSAWWWSFRTEIFIDNIKNLCVLRWYIHQYEQCKGIWSLGLDGVSRPGDLAPELDRHKMKGLVGQLRRQELEVSSSSNWLIFSLWMVPPVFIGCLWHSIKKNLIIDIPQVMFILWYKLCLINYWRHFEKWVFASSYATVMA